MASVSFKDVVKHFGGVTAVAGVSLEVTDGEFMVLVGPSGSGKTTALRMLAGLEAVSEGEIRIGDRLVNKIAPGERDVAMVFQDYALYPQMTVYDNLAFGLRRRKLSKQEIDRRVTRAGEMLDIGALLKRKPGQLSGGQAQRVALGRALVRDPQVFLMDEPLSNLDAKLRMQTRGEIKRLQHDIGTTTVYVTHDQVEAMTLGDRIAVMSDGALEQVGTPEELYDRPANRFVGSFIGSPAMSFFEVATQRDRDAVRLRGDGLELSVPGAPELPAEVTVGVRPEAARVWRDDEDLLGPLRGRVEYVEALGRETFVGVEAGGAQIVVHHDGRASLLPGDEIDFGLVQADLRFFGTDDGLALRSGNGAGPAPS